MLYADRVPKVEPLKWNLDPFPFDELAGVFEELHQLLIIRIDTFNCHSIFHLALPLLQPQLAASKLTEPSIPNRKYYIIPQDLSTCMPFLSIVPGSSMLEHIHSVYAFNPACRQCILAYKLLLRLDALPVSALPG
jgi:hypothetical protein